MNPIPNPTPSHRSTIVGICAVLGAYFFFTLSDAAAKWLMGSISAVQILCLRSLVVLLSCIMLAGKTTITKTFYSPLRNQLLLRGVFMLAAWFCYYSAATYLTLSEMVTLYFASPIFVAMLAPFSLKERVTYQRWIAIIIGFIGVLIASQLDHIPHLFPTLLVLLAAGFWAVNMILYRKDSAKESNIIQIFAMNLIVFLGSGLLSCWAAQPMSLALCTLMLFIALLNIIAQFMLLAGLRYIEASIAAPLEFSALIWAFILDFFLWGYQPIATVVIGAALISVSGALIIIEKWRSP